MYGTGGKCRKGTETDKEAEPKKVALKKTKESTETASSWIGKNKDEDGMVSWSKVPEKMIKTTKDIADLQDSMEESEHSFMFDYLSSAKPGLLKKYEKDYM